MKPPLAHQPLLFALFLCLALAGRLTGDPLNRPSWWTDEASRVILPDATENNLGAANIGQAKHMLTSALAALRPLLPDVCAQIEADLTTGAHPIVDLSVPEPKTLAWIDQQKAPLLIGQLKAIAEPFYTRLHAADPAWLEAERITNGTNQADSIFPWTPETSDDNNKAVATIGQLKAVFSLRFATLDPAHSLDSDGIGLFDVYANDTANERDDFIVLSPSGTRGRATNLNLLNLSAVDVVATVHLKNADGNVEFETSTALCPAGKMTKLRMWGRAVSSAVDQTTVLVDITANGRSLFTIEEAVTVYGEQTAFPSQPGPNDTAPNVIISPTSDSDEDGVPDLEEIASDHSPQSKLSFPPRWVSTDRYGWSPGTPNFIFARWMEPSGYAMEDDELTYLNQQLLKLNFPSAIPNIPNSGYALNGNQGRITSAGYDAYGNWGVIEHSCAWLETRPATRDLIRRTALKITRRYQDWDHEIECQVEPVEFTILPGATLSNRVDLIPELSHIQDGVVERLEQILLPVEVKNMRDLVNVRDDVEITPKRNVSDTNIDTVAWIDNHSSATNDAPRMPQLRLSISSLSSDMRIKAKLEVDYTRPYVGHQSQDRVRVPSNGDFREVTGYAWDIYNDADWTTAVSQGFFGGDATLTYQLTKADGTVVMQNQTILFRIAGQNPEDARCKDYIVAQSETAWFAYAIAKHESNLYGGEATYYPFTPVSPNNAKYNQFRAQGGGQSGTRVAGREGIPLIERAEASGPGGIGMFQVTGSATNETDIIPRAQLWNWQANVNGALTIIHHTFKSGLAARYFNDLQNDAAPYPAAYLEDPPPNIRFGTTDFSSSDAIWITAYNGWGDPISPYPVRGRYKFNPSLPPGLTIAPEAQTKRWFWNAPLNPDEFYIRKIERQIEADPNTD